MTSEVAVGEEAAKTTSEIEVQAGDGVVPLSLDELQTCDLDEMAKDKFKSRQLQRTLARGGKEHAEIIYAKAKPHIKELVKDQHGNYLLQKLMEVIDTEQFDSVFEQLSGDLLTLAKDTHGTRAVQKIVEQAVARERVEQLMLALPVEPAEELARNITGFHVIVKLLDSLPVDKSAPLLERLCGEPSKVLALGKDQWGCCVLKKCVDRSEGDMKEKIIDSIAQNALDLVQDAYGNYVVQHLLINRPTANPNVSRVIDALKGHIFPLCLQKYSSNVLEKCLSNSTDKDRNKIINEILNPPDNQKPSEAIYKLLFHQYGNYVFQQAMEVAKDPQFSLLIEHSKGHIQELYIEHTQQTAAAAQGTGTGRGAAEGAASSPTGGLTSEHTQRLAVKLVKKYPPLLEGVDLASMGMVGMDAAWMFDYDPMGYGQSAYYGFDAFGNPYPGFDMYGYGWQPPPQKGKGKGKNSRKGQGKGGKGGNKPRAAGQEAAAAPGAVAAGSSADTVRVGRIVGFWPNYTITYDEVPATKPVKKNRNAPGKVKKPAENVAAEA